MFNLTNYLQNFQIVHIICERILKLCGCWVNDCQSSNVPFSVDYISAKLHSNMKSHESTYSLNSLCSGNSEGKKGSNYAMHSYRINLFGSS